MTARLMAGLFFLLLFGIASCFLLGTLLWKRRLLLRLQALVDQAIAGTLAEEHFDESRLSALENSLWRYLQGSQASYQKLSEQKQRMEEWISDISHQAVTPLSNILLYSQLLEEALRETAKPDSSCGFSPQQTPSPSSTDPLDTLPEPAPGTPSESSGFCPNPEKPEGICYGLEEVAAIHEQAEKLDFFMQALQKLSRLEQGLLSLQPEEQDIAGVLVALRRQYLPLAGRKQIRLLIEPASGLAVFDRKWTIEAIGNLIDNAIKYTPEGGTVSIQLTEYLLFLRLDITDTGIGIREEELGSIFTRFYRSAEVRTEPGIGLGLYLAREVMKAQSGYLKVSSTPGEGSTFSVFLLRSNSSKETSF